MVAVSASEDLKVSGYRHEACFYSGDAEFVDALVPFVREGVDAGEPVLVALQQHKLELIREALDDDAALVDFLDIGDVGRNPARIIPAWRAFLDRRPQAWRLRGVGEPIWKDRTPEELVECQRHESLLNVAIGLDEPFWLVCPYDLDSLSDDVIDEAFRSHPYVRGRHRPAGMPARHRLEAQAAAFLDEPLTPPPPGAEVLSLLAEDVRAVRHRVREIGTLAGLGRDRVDDLELAVSEASANSVQHGGGAGQVTVWVDDAAVVCEVSDVGRLDDALVGRRAPAVCASSGRGLWLVNQLCDLTQIRVLPGGTAVRLHVDLCSTT